MALNFIQAQKTIFSIFSPCNYEILYYELIFALSFKFRK